MQFTSLVIEDEFDFQSSLLFADAMVKVCANYECKWMNAGAAKATDMSALTGVFSESRDSAMTKALTPPTNTIRNTVKAADLQQTVRFASIQRIIIIS